MKFRHYLNSAKFLCLTALTMTVTIARNVDSSPATQTSIASQHQVIAATSIAQLPTTSPQPNSQPGIPTSRPNPKPLPAPNPSLRAPNVNIIKNGTFTPGLGGWDANNTLLDRVGSPSVNVAAIQRNTGQLLQSFTKVVGARYRLIFDVLRPLVSTDARNYKVSTFPLASNISYKLSDLRPTTNGLFDRYSIEFTGANNSDSNATSVTDTINFQNNSPVFNFVITNVVIERI